MAPVHRPWLAHDTQLALYSALLAHAGAGAMGFVGEPVAIAVGGEVARRNAVGSGVTDPARRNGVGSGVGDGVADPPARKRSVGSAVVSSLSRTVGRAVATSSRRITVGSGVADTSRTGSVGSRVGSWVGGRLGMGVGAIEKGGGLGGGLGESLRRRAVGSGVAAPFDSGRARNVGSAV